MNSVETQTINPANEMHDCSFNTSIQQEPKTLLETNNTSIIEPHKETTAAVSESSPVDNDLTKSKMEFYMNALVHSTTCSQESCTFTKCLQLKRLTRHNKSCLSFINDRCEFCRQLIALSVYHAKNCTNQSGCLVPFCQTIKHKLEINRSIELIASYMGVIKYKAQKCQAVQTDMDKNITEGNKRKYSSLEDTEEGSTETLHEDSLRAKNLEMKQKKEAFFEKLAEIKLNHKCNESKNETQRQFNKQTREKIFATFFQQILFENPHFRKSRTPKDQNYANLIVLLLRREAEFSASADSEAYCYLITEMFYNLEKSLLKYKEVSSVSVGCQTEINANEEIMQSSPVNENSEAPNKRLKMN